MIKISVIVPVYNVEKYINKCIGSILNQTLKEFELILINDGSTDSSGDICDKFSAIDSRVKVIHKNNEGVSVARNIGIKMAKGEFIQFIDSDDWIEINMLENLLKKIKSDKSDVVFQGAIFEDYKGRIILEEKTKVDIIQKVNSNIQQSAVLLTKNSLFGYTWCKMFRRDIIEDNKIMFDETLTLAEDEKFTCDYFKFVNKISVLEKGYYHYIKYPTSRGNLSVTQTNNIWNRDKIFISWIELLYNDNTDITKEYLGKKAFSNLYEEVYKIYFSDLNKVERINKFNEMKNTNFYLYLNKNKFKISRNYNVIINIMKYNNKAIFKIYNKLYYILNKYKVI